MRAIANYAVGTDNVDLDAATGRGIPVGNTPDVLTETTADLAWALLMAAPGGSATASARCARGVGDVRARTLLGVDVHGATLGVVGWGRIGQAVGGAPRGSG